MNLFSKFWNPNKYTDPPLFGEAMLHGEIKKKEKRSTAI